MSLLKRYLFSLFLILSMFNTRCHNSELKGQVRLTNSINILKTIRIRNPNKDSTIFLSEFANEVKIIPLEFNLQCILGVIKKIIIVDNSILIHDSQNNEGIFRFDMNGKFICRIGKLGKGPQEHNTLTDFSINPDTKNIYIYSNTQRKVMEYSLNNIFIKETSLNFASENMEFKNNFFYMYRENPQLYESYNLIIKDMDGKTVARYFKSENGKRTRSMKVFSIQQNHLLFNPSLNDTVYILKGTNLEYAYLIDYGKHAIKTEDRLALMEWSNNVLKILNENHYISGINNILKINDTLFFTYVYQNIENRAFYNIKTGELVHSYSMMDDLTWFSFSNPISQTEDSFVAIYDPNSIENNIKNINYHSGKLIPTEKAKAAIAKLNSIKQSNIDSMNPFVLLYKIN